LRVVVLEHIPEDDDLRRQWNALVDRTPRPQVFYTFEWAIAVQRAYGELLKPFIFLAYDERDSLCGVAGLALNAKNTSVSFFAATTGDYCDFLCSPDQRPAFVAQVLHELKRRGINKVVFTNLPADSGTLADIRRAAGHNGYLCFVRSAYVCAQVSFDRLERGKEGKVVAPGLKRIRRFVKAMGTEAPVRFDHSRSWDAVEPILPEFTRAHVARFLEIGRISNFVSADRRKFLAELARALSGPEWLLLSRMFAGDRAVAWHYGFQFRDTVFWYQPTFDSSVEKHWPGFCILTHVIQEALENPAMTTLDLGLGSEAYKAKFANASRETLYVTLHRSAFGHWAEALRYRAVAGVRAYPWTEKAAEWVRTQFRAIHGRLVRKGPRRMLGWAAARFLRTLGSRDEVVFYELSGSRHPTCSSELSLKPVDLDLLATAAMQYEHDEETLTYFVRSAKRVREKERAGFALFNRDGQPVHFLWTAPFAGFYLAELNDTVAAPSPDSVLVFDCWTPVSQRGRGYYAPALALVAATIREQSRQPWVFSAASNQSSVRGIEKGGFPRRFSVIRLKILWWRRTSRTGGDSAMESGKEVSSQTSAESRPKPAA